MKLPTWNWHEARKQFEMRIPGLLPTRTATWAKLQEVNRLTGRKA